MPVLWIPKWEAQSTAATTNWKSPPRPDLRETDWRTMLSVGGAIGPGFRHLVASVLFFVSVGCPTGATGEKLGG